MLEMLKVLHSLHFKTCREGKKKKLAKAFRGDPSPLQLPATPLMARLMADTRATIQRRYRQRRRDKVRSELVDAGWRVREALALMERFESVEERREALSELLELGAARYIEQKNSYR
jgi:hypothetical protein